MRADGTPTETNQTPIPGLRVEISEEISGTPVAIHQIITGQDGAPLTEVQVDSASELLIQSADDSIAKFAASGEASAFAEPLAPAIIATPMVEIVGACLTEKDGTPVAELKYSNINPESTPAIVPITGLSPDLYLTPEVTEDDLLLNAIRLGDENVIPDSTFRAPEPNQTSQLFNSGEGTFTVPYSSNSGSLVWNLIGKQMVVDGSAAQCEEQGQVQCQLLSRELLERSIAELRVSVTNTLRIAAKLVKAGKNPYLRQSAWAVRNIKDQAYSLIGSYVCPQQAALPNSCSRMPFPAKRFKVIHESIWRKQLNLRPKTFAKIKRVYTKRYNQFIDKQFPPEIVRCQR